MNSPADGIRISCRSLWKLHGPAPAEFLRAPGGAPDLEAVREEDGRVAGAVSRQRIVETLFGGRG